MLCPPVLATQSQRVSECALTVLANNSAKSQTAWEARGRPQKVQHHKKKSDEMLILNLELFGIYNWSESYLKINNWNDSYKIRKWSVSNFKQTKLNVAPQLLQ